MALNKYQSEVIKKRKGLNIVEATAGSGKTYTVEHLVAQLLSEKPQPRVGVFTFSKNAATELGERISRQLYPFLDEQELETKRANTKLFKWVCTIHALSLRLLKKHGLKFRVLAGKEEWEVENLLKDSLKELDWEQGLKQVRHWINKGSINLVSPVSSIPEQFYTPLLREHGMGRFAKEMGELYNRYHRFMEHRNLVDFTMMQAKVIELIRTDPKFCDRLAKMFDYVIVDEAQDTSPIQMEIIDALCRDNQNLTLVGDVDQCVIAETEVMCYNKTMLASDISIGDKIATGCGDSKVKYASVENIFQTEVKNAPVITVETESGKKLTTTPEHIYFAEHIIENRIPEFYTYLMYKKDFGYRVGVTSAYRKLDKKRIDVGYRQRLRAERADAIWILGRYNTRGEAQYYEQLYSVRYGLPTWVFYMRKNMMYNNKDIRQLFQSIDTHQGASNLLSDLWMFVDFPHHVPRAMNKKRRRNFTITLCADSRQDKPFHRCYISGSSKSDESKLNKAGIKTRSAKNSRGWRIETMNQKVSKLYELLDKVRDTGIMPTVKEQIRLTSKSLAFTPASHVLSGMIVFVFDGEKIIEEHVTSVKRHFYTGTVYDFDTPPCHNFSANGIMVHNSMYAFRGAVPEVLRRDEFDRFVLPINYRSTKSIIEAGRSIIENNYLYEPELIKPFQARPKAPKGKDIPYISSEFFQTLESNLVALLSEDGKFGDWFILSRTRAECASIHAALVSAGISAINKSGGLLFGAPHVRKVLAYARLACNYNDARNDLDILNEIANVASNNFISPINRRLHIEGCTEERFWIDCGCPLVLEKGKSHTTSRYYGIKALQKARNWSGIKSQQYEKNNGGYPTLAAHGAQDLVKFVELIETAKESAIITLDTIIDECVLPWLMEQEGISNEDLAENGKIEDFALLLRMTEPKMTVEDFLIKVDEITKADTADDDGSAVIIGTFHWAKGTEREKVVINLSRCPIVPPQARENELPIGSPPLLEEERRLAFVGITRAKDEAWIFAAQEWLGNKLPESQFIGELLTK